MAVIAERLGLKEKAAPPEIDERCEFWLWLYGIADRGRPYTMGSPLPLPPLDILSLIDRLALPANPDEALEVIGAMDVVCLEHISKGKGK